MRNWDEMSIWIDFNKVQHMHLCQNENVIILVQFVALEEHKNRKCHMQRHFKTIDSLYFRRIFSLFFLFFLFVSSASFSSTSEIRFFSFVQFWFWSHPIRSQNLHCSCTAVIGQCKIEMAFDTRPLSSQQLFTLLFCFSFGIFLHYALG